MAYDGKLLRRAKTNLEKEQQSHQRQLDSRRQEVYLRIPRIAQIDAQLRRTTPRIIADSFRQGVDPAPALALLRQENLQLQEERAALLATVGLPADYLEDAPLCPLCGDTGWQKSGALCDCLKRHYVRAQMEELSQLLDLGSQSFETFSLDLYSTETEPYGQGISPRDNMKRNFLRCRDYARQFHRRSENLLLSGNPGLGKTFLSACIARQVSEQGFSVVYDTAAHIFSLFEAQKFGREEDGEDGVSRILRCDLLIMDDLGTEMTTAFVQSALYHIVNERLLHGSATIINTNLPPNEIGRRYSPQILSRILGEYTILPFFGDDIRKSRHSP